MGAFSLSDSRLELLRSANDIPAPPIGRAGFPPPHAGFILALTDPTPDGVNAAWRAGLVARDRGVPLQLLCVHSDASERASVQTAVRELADRIRRRLHVPACADRVPGVLHEQLRARSERAGLLVVPWKRGNPLVDLLLGSQAERLFRSLFLPTLVVRRPALGSYRRVLVPVKLDADASTLVKAARSMSRGPRMQVLHVVDTWEDSVLRRAGVPEPAVRLQRQHRSRHASSALDEIIRRAGAHEEGASAQVSMGHVSACVLRTARAGDAQLIVAGRERRSLLAELLLPSVTQRLLLEAAADVLVLPVSPQDVAFDAAVPHGATH